MNYQLFKSMIDFYNSKAYTHNYIFGFEYHGNIYMTTQTLTVLPMILKLDRASRGAGMALKFAPTSDIKQKLLCDASVICSKIYFEELVSNSKYNRGEIFEKLVTEMSGQEWKKDNVPFTKDGDITIDGIAYQIKYQKASFINEAQINRLR